MPILLCPVADWLVDGHAGRLERLGVGVWSGRFDLQELLGTVAAAVQDTAAPA